MHNLYYIQSKESSEKLLQTASIKLREHVNRAKIRCVVLNERPVSHLAALALSNAINRLDDVNYIDSATRGGTPIILGGKTAGHALDLPITAPWLFVNVKDPLLSQCAYRITSGDLVLGSDLEVYEIPMTVLGDVLGPLTREIIGCFRVYRGDQHPPHHVLEGVESQLQTSLIVEPNASASELQAAARDKTNRLLESKSRVHFNLECRFTSQRLVAMYTNEKALGGTQLPTVSVPEEHEKAFVVWANSTLGILCFWSHVPKQQLGRSKATKSGIVNMPVLDFGSLQKDQLEQFNETFDTYAKENLGKIMNLAVDEVRHKLDEDVMEILGLGDVSLHDLRQRLAREPSISQQGKSA